MHHGKVLLQVRYQGEQGTQQTAQDLIGPTQAQKEENGRRRHHEGRPQIL